MSYLWFVFEMFVNLAYGILWCYFIVKYFGFKENIKSRYLIVSLFSLILFVVISVFNYFIIYEGFLISIYAIVAFIFALIFLNGSSWEKLVISILKQALLASVSLTIPLTFSILFEEEFADMYINVSSMKKQK